MNYFFWREKIEVYIYSLRQNLLQNYNCRCSKAESENRHFVPWLYANELDIQLQVNSLLVHDVSNNHHFKCCNLLLWSQVERADIARHIKNNCDANGNSFCHSYSCYMSYSAYRINSWGLRNPEENKRKNRDMSYQQADNFRHHMSSAHGNVCVNKL